MFDPVSFRLAALFFFTLATVGFVIFLFRFPRGSDVQVWGIRVSYALGFTGLALLSLWKRNFNEVSVVIFSSLLLSLLAFELTSRYLNK
ncbi:MAG TPA: hypothetical protein VMN76_10115 [Acidobacteriota bacterium]|nr:hypothetical protein [Acidobacteriota bacterium]HUG44581.1 hypothetical protein [Acidobacteriota bacterium]